MDSANVSKNGGTGLRYAILRDLACRDGAAPIRLNTYVTFDPDRAATDTDYKHRAWTYQAALRDAGFKVIVKNIKWYIEEDGSRVGKANADLDMAVDVLLQSENMDRVVLCTGDGDFVQVVRALQNRGCRVEVIGFNSVSGELRREADSFISGFTIPDLVPSVFSDEARRPWGEVGSRVRGACYDFDQVKGFGFLRYLARIDGNPWITRLS